MYDYFFLNYLRVFYYKEKDAIKYSKCLWRFLNYTAKVVKTGIKRETRIVYFTFQSKK